MKFHIKYVPELASTNQYAFGLLAGNPDGSDIAIRTGHQFAGKGAGDHIWESEAGVNILSSLVIHPEHIRPATQFVLSKIAALAVADVVADYAPGAGVKIKWPNDVYAGDNKIAGILIQHQHMGSVLKSSVIGIGLNINQQVFPSDLPNPVSLFNLTGELYNLDLVFLYLLELFGKWYAKTQESDFSEIDEAYRSRMYRLDEQHEYIIHGKRKTAIIKDVDELGHLMLDDGKKTSYYGVDEVKFVL